MFTGLITDLGTVTEVTNPGDTHVTIQTGYDMASVEDGASIACSGVCLTVVERGDDWFRVTASKETLDRTNLGDWQVGRRINLERSLTLGQELGGHFVFGHVDGLATLKDVRQEGESWRLKIQPPADLMPYVASKGSISIDGISLTVNEVSDDSFGVNIIPHTWTATTLQHAEIGQRLNIEIDMLARYVARQLECRT
ncbi:MAG: riboflavin synthase [Alphaproteobacteria bacterium]|nr:riboflavin synthase [Alphaproteobacteria bacterium SS10]